MKERPSTALIRYPNAEMLSALGLTHVLFAPARQRLHAPLKIPSRIIRDALQELTCPLPAVPA